VFGFVYSRLKTALLPEFRRAWSKDFDASVRTLQRELSHVQAELAELRRTHDTLVVKEWTQSREPLLANLDARLAIEPRHAPDRQPRSVTTDDVRPSSRIFFQRISTSS
jgi:hypothetical protein